MTIDPNVQVALVSVIATTVTTMGVIAVAIINNRKERAKAANAGVEAGLDERDVLERMLALMSENDRLKAAGAKKDKQISELRADVAALRKELQAKENL